MLTNIIEDDLEFIDLVFELMINQIKSKVMGNYIILEDFTDFPNLTI